MDQHKTTRNAVRNLRAATEKEEAAALFPKVVSMLDKLAKKSVIHKNKAGNIKSKLAKKDYDGDGKDDVMVRNLNTTQMIRFNVIVKDTLNKSFFKGSVFIKSHDF